MKPNREMHRFYVSQLNWSISSLKENLIIDLSQKTLDDLIEDDKPAIFETKQGKMLKHYACGHWNHLFFLQTLTEGKSKGPSEDVKKKITKKYRSVQEMIHKFVEMASTTVGSQWVWLVIKSSPVAQKAEEEAQKAQEEESLKQEQVTTAATEPGTPLFAAKTKRPLFTGTTDVELKIITTEYESSPQHKDPIGQKPELSVTYEPILCLDMWEHAFYEEYGLCRRNYAVAFWKYMDWNSGGTPTT